MKPFSGGTAATKGLLPLPAHLGEWDATRNGPLRADVVDPDAPVWWHCIPPVPTPRLQHRWQATPAEREEDPRCPYCVVLLALSPEAVGPSARPPRIRVWTPRAPVARRGRWLDLTRDQVAHVLVAVGWALLLDDLATYDRDALTALCQRAVDQRAKDAMREDALFTTRSRVATKEELVRFAAGQVPEDRVAACYAMIHRQMLAVCPDSDPLRQAWEERTQTLLAELGDARASGRPLGPLLWRSRWRRRFIDLRREIEGRGPSAKRRHVSLDDLPSGALELGWTGDVRGAGGQGNTARPGGSSPAVFEPERPSRCRALFVLLLRAFADPAYPKDDFLLLYARLLRDEGRNPDLRPSVSLLRLDWSTLPPAPKASLLEGLRAAGADRDGGLDRRFAEATRVHRAVVDALIRDDLDDPDRPRVLSAEGHDASSIPLPNTRRAIQAAAGYTSDDVCAAWSAVARPASTKEQRYEASKYALKQFTRRYERHISSAPTAPRDILASLSRLSNPELCAWLDTTLQDRARPLPPVSTLIRRLTRNLGRPLATDAHTVERAVLAAVLEQLATQRPWLVSGPPTDTRTRRRRPSTLEQARAWRDADAARNPDGGDDPPLIRCLRAALADHTRLVRLRPDPEDADDAVLQHLLALHELSAALTWAQAPEAARAEVQASLTAIADQALDWARLRRVAEWMSRECPTEANDPMRSVWRWLLQSTVASRALPARTSIALGVPLLFDVRATAFRAAEGDAPVFVERIAPGLDVEHHLDGEVVIRAEGAVEGDAPWSRSPGGARRARLRPGMELNLSVEGRAICIRGTMP